MRFPDNKRASGTHNYPNPTNQPITAFIIHCISASLHKSNVLSIIHSRYCSSSRNNSIVREKGCSLWCKNNHRDCEYMDLVTTDSIQSFTVEYLYPLITSVYNSVSISQRSSLYNEIQMRKSVRYETKTITWGCEYMDLVTTDSMESFTVEHLYPLITSLCKCVSLSHRSSLDNSTQMRKCVHCDAKTTTRL